MRIRPGHVLIPLAAFLTVIALLGRWGSVSQRPLIQVDGQGYYAYLPAEFVYHDLQFNFAKEQTAKYYPESQRYDFISETPKGNVNKYFVGTSLLMAPFFGLGHVGATIGNSPQDGYSWPYQMAIGLGALFYLILGCWLLWRTGSLMGFSSGALAVAIPGIVLASALPYYAIVEPAMSHVYSFFSVCLFLFFGRWALASGRVFPTVATAAILGLIVMIRPVNGVVLLALPMLATDAAQMRMALRRLGSPLTLGPSLVAFLAHCCVQPLVYYIQTGSPVVWSYGSEGFDFLHPNIFEVLIGFQKGLLIYTPIVGLALLGFVLRLWHEKFRPLMGLLFFATAVWIMASWWMWWYGGSLGMRPFLEFLPVMCIGLLWLWDDGGWIQRLLQFGLIVFFCVLSLTQTYQYFHGILPYEGMNSQRYTDLFMRTKLDLVGYYPAHGDGQNYAAKDSIILFHDMEARHGWGNEDSIHTTDAHSGTRAFLLGDGMAYGLTYKDTVLRHAPNGFDLVKVEAWVKADKHSTNAALVVSLEDESGGYYWATRPIRLQLRTDGWNHVSGVFRTGPVRSTRNVLAVYMLKSDQSKLWIDDMKLTLLHHVQ